MSEMPLESPAEDVAEQRVDVLPDEAESEAESGSLTVPGWEVDPADAQEQAVEVPLRDDEWQ